MIRFAHHLRTSLGRGALLALALAAPMAHATAAPLALPSPSVAPLQELPIRYAGEGMVILVTSYDEAAGVAAGTLQIGSAAALPFTIELTTRSDGTQVGKGKVKGPKRSRRISTKESADGTITVSYRAKRYDVTLQGSGPAPDEVVPEKVKEKKRGRVSAAPGKKASATAPKGTIRLRKKTFNDPQFNGRPSHSILVPVGWEAKGGAYWLPNNYFQVMPSQDITVKSPEGVSVRIEPTFTARDIIPVQGMGVQRPQEGMSDGGFPIIYLPEDLEAWKRLVLEKAMPEAHPKAKNMRVKDAMVIPDLTQMLHRELEPHKRRVAQENQLNHQMQMNSFVDGWALGFECRFTEGGQEFEEFRLMIITAMGTEGQLIGRSTTWSQTRGITFTAPVGRLEAEAPLLMAVMGSMQETLPWMQNRAQLMAKIQKISHQVAMDNLKAAAKRSKIMSDAYSDVNAISMAGHRSRNASSDRSHQNAVNAINETAYYSVPGSSTQVQLPSGYDHVYSNGNDEYLLTNDALFQPGVELEGNWKAMKAAR